MNLQLRWITSLLQDNNVPYWLDCGSLLGLTREGRLLDHDNDIDIGLWREDAPRLEAVLEGLDRDRFWVKRYFYRGRVFKIKISLYRRWLWLMKKSRRLEIDFFVFDRGKPAKAWCPQIVKPLQGPVNKWKNKVFWTLMSHTDFDVHVDGFPWRHLYKLHTWVIPAAFFADVRLSPEYEVSIPKSAEDYLSYRYGDWRVVRKDWVTERDDRCLKAVDPDVCFPENG